MEYFSENNNCQESGDHDYLNLECILTTQLGILSPVLRGVCVCVCEKCMCHGVKGEEEWERMLRGSGQVYCLPGMQTWNTSSYCTCPHDDVMKPLHITPQPQVGRIWQGLQGELLCSFI